MTDEIQQENNAPDAATLAVEKEARQFGWTPKEEFKGDENQWRTAEEFLQRGREINGFLRKDLEKIQGKNLSLEAELRAVREAVKEFKTFHEQTEERSYKKALAELQTQKKEAIKDADGDAVIAAEEAIEQLKEDYSSKKATTVVETPQTDALYQQQFIAWTQQNEWFQNDKALRAAANGFADEVKDENPTLKGTPFLEAVSAKVREAFPEKFENLREKPQAVEGNTGTPRTSSSKKSYADLPADAKAACDMFVKQGLVTKEQYIKDYFED